MLPRKSTLTKWVMSCVVMVIVIYTVFMNNAAPVEDGRAKLDHRGLLQIPKEPSGDKKEKEDIKVPAVQSVQKLTYEPTTEKPVNPHDFKYLIKPKSGCEDNIFLIIYVHTHPDYYKRRLLIRQTWGNPKNYKEKIRVVFFMGKGEKQKVQDSLLFESATYGDIVQEEFMDSYKNLTYKGIAALKWITLNCPKAKFTLKTDDDIFVNMFNLLRHLKSRSQYNIGRDKLVLCLTWHNMKVLRDKNSKWYISEEDFKLDHFPVYCSGSAFIFSTDIIPSMYYTSFLTPFIWVDDYYITGALVNKLGLNHTQFISVYSLQKAKFEEHFLGPNGDLFIFAHTHEADKIRMVWNRIVSKEGSTMKSDNLIVT